VLQKEEKKGEEKYEENKMNFEGVGGFTSNLELEVPHPEEICTENFVCLCSRSFELQMRENSVFFTPVKYTLVCPTPKVSFFLGRTTHYRVS